MGNRVISLTEEQVALFIGILNDHIEVYSQCVDDDPKEHDTILKDVQDSEAILHLLDTTPAYPKKAAWDILSDAAYQYMEVAGDPLGDEAEHYNLTSAIGELDCGGVDCDICGQWVPEDKVTTGPHDEVVCPECRVGLEQEEEYGKGE